MKKSVIAFTQIEVYFQNKHNTSQYLLFLLFISPVTLCTPYHYSFAACLNIFEGKQICWVQAGLSHTRLKTGVNTVGKSLCQATCMLHSIKVEFVLLKPSLVPEASQYLLDQ